MTRIDRRPTAALDPEWLPILMSIFASAFEGRFAVSDWDHAVGGRHVVAFDEAELVGHASVVSRPIEVGDRRFDVGYVEAVATRPDRQGTGIGTVMMREIDVVIRDTYEMGALATGEHHFYERLGWERWRGKTYVRTSEGVVRSPDEDDAIMVLRFGTTEAIDLTANISCDEREGDDW